MSRLIIKEIADKLNALNLKYGDDIPKDIQELAKNKDVAICYGRSDDLLELVGAIDDEYSCLYGGDISIIEDTLSIEALWGVGDASWSYNLERCNEKFKIYEEHEDGELFCEGMVFEVFELKNPKQTGGDLINAMSNEKLADLLCMGEHCPSNIGLNEIGCNEASDVDKISCKQCWLNVLESETE